MKTSSNKFVNHKSSTEDIKCLMLSIVSEFWLGEKLKAVLFYDLGQFNMIDLVI